MPQPEEKENEIWVRVKDPGLFQKDSFRRIALDQAKGISAVVGKLKGENKTTIQALRFDKAKGWTISKAVAWRDAHKFETNKFFGDSGEVNLDELYEQGEIFEYADTYNIEDKEIFATGTWKGDKYTTKDLDDMVEAFNAMRDHHDVPLKLGHDEHQKLLQKDGYPAAGWLTKLKRVGQKLVASFAKVPRVIKDLIDRGAYRHVSSEIYWNYKDPKTGRLFRRALVGVALLGADRPAVAGLKAWDKLYSESHTYSMDIDEQGRITYEQFVCECLKCGYKMRTDQHCDTLECPKCGGPMRRAERPGPGKMEDDMTKFAEWDTKYINDLPDSSFAFISPGGEKDEEGKTTPRALRHLPYKDKNGKIDLPHLRNALARLPQTNLSPAEKAKARAVLVRAAKSVGVGDYDQDEYAELQKKVKEVEKEMELEEKVKQLEAKVKEMTDELDKTKKLLAEKEQQLQKINAEKKKQEFASFLDKAIEEGKIFPAQKAHLLAMMESADGGKKVKFSATGKAEDEVETTQVDIIKQYIEHLPKLSHLVELSEDGTPKQKKQYVDDETGSAKSKELNDLAEERAKDKKITYTEALKEVSREHPELVETTEEE